ncbi:MAG: DUF7507 domain-containing protein, partial [Verrucomicrobiota bacterium]
MKRLPLLLTLGMASISLLFQGCETAPTTDMEGDSAPQMAEPGQSVAEITQSEVIKLRKSVDEFATVGQDFTYTYEITPLATVKDVVLTDMVPEGLSFVSADPQATQSGSDLRWEFSRLEKGQVQTVRATMRADAVGSYRNCATITAIPVACTLVQVTKPDLMLAKSVDRDTYKVGETANFTLMVRNTGNSAARNVVITDTIPAGLRDLEDRAGVQYSVGTLEAGESQTFTLPLQTTERGTFVNSATVTASNVVEDENDTSEAEIEVLIPGLEISKEGPAEEFTGKRARYTITVDNTGETVLEDVVVTDRLPAEYEVINSGGGNYDAGSNTITWNIASIDAGESQELDIIVTTLTAGSFTNSVNVT